MEEVTCGFLLAYGYLRVISFPASTHTAPASVGSPIELLGVVARAGA